MAKRNVNYYLTKLVRITGWFLFAVLPTTMISGYIMCGEFGFDRLAEAESALAVHKALDIPLLVILLLHALPATYFAFRRWGWIPRRATA